MRSSLFTILIALIALTSCGKNDNFNTKQILKSDKKNKK